MDDRKFYTCVGTCVLAYLSTVLGITAVSTTYWADFYLWAPPQSDKYKGHFGPWSICTETGFNRESCGEQFTQFRPSTWSMVSGVFCAIGVALILEVCILAPLHLVMLCSKERVLISYKHAVIAKLCFATTGGFAALLSVMFFNLQGDRRDTGFTVKKAWSYYLQMVVVILDVLLCLGCGFELRMARQLGGDPTKYSKDVEGTKARTIVNPGYREDPNKHHQHHSKNNNNNGSHNGHQTNGQQHRRPSSNSSSTAGGGGGGASTVVSSVSSRSSRSSSRRRSGSFSGSSAGSSSFFGGGPAINHAGHNHRRRARSSSTSKRRGSSGSRRRRRSVGRTHSFSMSELGALPHQVGPDGQIISGSNLSLNNGFKRVPPPLTMLPLKSSLKKKRPAVSTDPNAATPVGHDVSDSSAAFNTSSLSPGSAGGNPDESVSSWSSDVPGLSIHNPHFSPESEAGGGSPSLSTLTRTGSMKKVRIQTRSTDV